MGLLSAGEANTSDEVREQRRLLLKAVSESLFLLERCDLPANLSNQIRFHVGGAMLHLAAAVGEMSK